MHRLLIIMAVALVAAVLIAPAASARPGNAYGYAWYFDADGDGIPNGQDSDYDRFQDRKQDGNGTPAGDLLRLRLRLRDGSCQ